LTKNGDYFEMDWDRSEGTICFHKNDSRLVWTSSLEYNHPRLLAFSQDIVLVRWFDRTNNKSQLKIHR
jgi:hypothetical protein